MKKLIKPEPLTVMAFLLGLLYSSIFGGGSIFNDVVAIFIRIFILVAPFIVFTLIFLSTSRILIYIGKSPSLGGRLIIYTLLFSYLAVIFALVVMYPYIHRIGALDIGLLYEEAASYIRRIIVSPLMTAIIIALVSPLIFSRYIASNPSLIDGLYHYIISIFKALLYIMPIVAFSFGVKLYVSISTLSIPLILSSILTELVYGLIYLLVASLIVSVSKRVPTRLVLKYVAKAFVYCLPAGGSYLALPINLNVYREVFREEYFGSLALSIGASINRAGSVGGALIVVGLASIFVGSPTSLSQLFMIGLILPFVSLGAPGLYGGTLIVGMPLVLDVLGIGELHPIAISSLAIFVSVLTYIQASLNTVTNGLMGILIGELGLGSD